MAVSKREAVALAYGRRLSPAQKKASKAPKLAAIQPLRKVRY